MKLPIHETDIKVNFHLSLIISTDPLLISFLYNVPCLYLGEPMSMDEARRLCTDLSDNKPKCNGKVAPVLN
jgi:hypothetical protein